MRTRPYQVFLLIWAMLLGAYLLDTAQDAPEAQERLRSDPRVTATVIEAQSLRSGSIWLDLRIPLTLGVTRCNASVASSEYQTLGRTVEVHVGKLGSDPFCWTVRELTKTASRTTGDRLVTGALFACLLGMLAYFLVVRIRFGALGKSLKSRWEEDRYRIK